MNHVQIDWELQRIMVVGNLKIVVDKETVNFVSDNNMGDSSNNFGHYNRLRSYGFDSRQTPPITSYVRGNR